jgi:hypothetical protein
VGDFKLTAQRRGELAVLLDDERRFAAEYPKVAEYLCTAPALRGTGDTAADETFDLRVLHYMTGGQTDGNPYWDIVAPSVTRRGGRRVIDGGRESGSPRLAYAQMLLQAAYAYAIPSPETVSWIAGHCGRKRLVEIGAGRGYWARQLADLGLAVSSFDSEPPNERNNVSFLSIAGQPDTWHPIGDLKALAADPPEAGDVLLLCWPPGWGNTMASTALTEFAKAGGHELVFVGEPQGGKTGDEAFFAELTARWQLADQDEQFVSWWNLADTAQYWRAI